MELGEELGKKEEEGERFKALQRRTVGTFLRDVNFSRPRY